MALPTSLLASIRLRLATVLESDAAVHLLLQLSAVMGGACTLTAVQACLPPSSMPTQALRVSRRQNLTPRAPRQAVWAVLGKDGGAMQEAVGSVLERAVKLKFMKQLSSSGLTRGSPGMISRRRSSGPSSQVSSTACRVCAARTLNAKTTVIIGFCL